jgi:hypothetical protein
MVAAGIGDHPAAALSVRERSDFVVGPTELECADGLKVFELQKKAALVRYGAV